MAAIAVPVLALTLLAACRAAVPTPPLERAVRARPVTVLQARAGARVRVPAAALVHRGGIPGVFVLQPAAAFPPPARDAEGKPLPEARFRMVKPARTARGQVEILSGLDGDETLVLGPLSDVHDGSPIVPAH